MKTPDQSVPNLKDKKIEKRDLLLPILQILKETAEKFRSLDQEATTAIFSRKDTATYKQKLEERAQLLIALPSQLSSILEGIESEAKKKIVNDTEWFATSAKEALENDKTGFLLETLLTHQGGKAGDKNDLEKLIASLEKELVINFIDKSQKTF